MPRPSRISQCCDLQLQRNISQSPRIQGGVAILTNHCNFPANLSNHWRRLGGGVGVVTLSLTRRSEILCPRPWEAARSERGALKSQRPKLPATFAPEPFQADPEPHRRRGSATWAGVRQLDDPHDTEPPYRNPPGCVPQVADRTDPTRLPLNGFTPC